MLTTLFKKKITESQIANEFVGGLIRMTHDSFPLLVTLINDDPEFKYKPDVKVDDINKFLMIVLAGNILFLRKDLESSCSRRVEQFIYKGFEKALGVDAANIEVIISQYHSYFGRVNHPSKNTIYAMSKTVFFKYDLNRFQDDYFYKMKTPNPIFLKRLDELVQCFLWNWSEYSEKYKII